MKIEKFLDSEGFSLSPELGAGICEKAVIEMKKGLSPEGSSLKMLPSFVGGGVPEAEKPVIIIDAGGSNLRIGTMYFDKDLKPVIDELEKSAMPGLEKPISADEFYSELASRVKHVSGKSDKIGFCFSYPSRITPEKDAEVLLVIKEWKARVKGTMVGESLRKYLSPGNPEEFQVTVINDTVAALLGGKSAFMNENCSNWIGLIVGTGTNMAYIERVSEFSKLTPDEAAAAGDKEMAVNCETGDICVLPYTAYDDGLDSGSDAPGFHRAEKMISGKYLGALTALVISGAYNKGLFSETVSKGLREFPILETEEISRFLADPSKGFGGFTGMLLAEGTKEDIEGVLLIIRRMIRRSAFFIACELCAVLKKTGDGKDPDKPVGIMPDGSTFFGLPGYQDTIKEYMPLILGHDKRYYIFRRAENPNLAGAGLAALSRTAEEGF
ncbi:MAG: hypothetical protein ACLFQK_03665 [Fibrobacterota bacterium]